MVMATTWSGGWTIPAPDPVSWAYLSCEAAGRYFARKEKSVLATAVLAGLGALASLVSYILETLP